MMMMMMMMMMKEEEETTGQKCPHLLRRAAIEVIISPKRYRIESNVKSL